MAEVVLFHHALGLSQGVIALAEDLRAAGHLVHTPDLFAGPTFVTLDQGVQHAQEVGFGEIVQRGARAVDGLASGLVYVGLSLGVLPRSTWLRRAPARRVRSSSMPACRVRNSVQPGGKICPRRSMQWTPARSALARVISRRPRRWPASRQMAGFSSIPATHISFPTGRSRPLIQPQQRFLNGGCATFSRIDSSSTASPWLPVPQFK